ncbi:MAG TPA: hypothetical protein VFL14_15830 [Xanthomonadales bacterium]|nr:hypothetical protein [Xanthomonadales bacterium]
MSNRIRTNPTAFRRLLPLAALLVATAAPAREVAWSYIDGGEPIDSAITADGTSFFLSADGDGHRVTRVGPDGTVAWTRRHPGQLSALKRRSSVEPLEFGHEGAVVRAGRACWTAYRNDARAAVIACFDADDGDAAPQRTLATELAEQPFALLERAVSVLPDGSVMAVAARSGTVDLVASRWNAAGERVLDRLLGSGLVLAPAFADDGRVAFRTSDDTDEIAIVSPDGAQRRIDAAVHGLRAPRARFAPDGDLVLAGFGAADGRPRVSRLAADGTPRWSTVIGERTAPADAFAAVNGFQLVATGGRLLVLAQDIQSAPENGFLRSRTRLADLVAASGAPKWLRETTDAGYLGADRDGNPFLVSRGTFRFLVASLDPDTGAPRWREAYACTGSFSCPLDFAAGGDGLLRVIVTNVEGNAFRYGTKALASAFDRGPGVPAAQPGVTGAWYPTYAAGSGFVIDYFPAMRTLFAPWFTQGPVGGLNPESPLRWYSLQGTASPDSPTVELDILMNEGGSFARPPVTTARRVGRATLRFESCSLANLEFAFDPGYYPTRPDAFADVLSLTRLTPRIESCRLADGTSQPASTTPRAGFDARQSGAWYDPATSGQGIMLTVDPQSALFGAWFTYDAADVGDDTPRHAWFSLQAGLANAQDGRVVASIYRTEGGGVSAVPSNRTVKVGEATLSFEGCQRLRVDYRFEGPDTGMFGTTPPGTLNLVRIGGCTAP